MRIRCAAQRVLAWRSAFRSGAPSTRPVRLHMGVASSAAGGDWQANLIADSPERVQQVARDARRVAVLGIKTEQQAAQPAFYVAQYLHQQPGVEVIPVPVFYPDVTEILGQPVYRKLADIPGPQIDIVDVFRKPSDVEAHLEDLLACKPKCVWLQSGIRAPAAEVALARAGILVVADRCLMVVHRAAGSRL